MTGLVGHYYIILSVKWQRYRLLPQSSSRTIKIAERAKNCACLVASSCTRQFHRLHNQRLVEN